VLDGPPATSEDEIWLSWPSEAVVVLPPD
jgi:hypothetical protein